MENQPCTWKLEWKGHEQRVEAQTSERVSQGAAREGRQEAPQQKELWQLWPQTFPILPTSCSRASKNSQQLNLKKLTLPPALHLQALWGQAPALNYTNNEGSRLLPRSLFFWIDTNWLYKPAPFLDSKLSRDDIYGCYGKNTQQQDTNSPIIPTVFYLSSAWFI